MQFDAFLNIIYIYVLYNLSISSQAKLNTHTRYGSTRPYHSSESEKQNIKENMKKRDREQCDRVSAMSKWTKKHMKIPSILIVIF